MVSFLRFPHEGQSSRPWYPGALLAIAALLFCTAPAHAAACNPSINLGDTPVSFPATISIPVNAPIGSVIATTTVAVSGTAGTTYSNTTCGTSGTIYWQINTGPVVANRVGTTSVKGIGYTASLSGGGLPGNISTDTQLAGSSLPNNSGADYFPSQVFVTVNLVVTGPVGSGTLSLNPTGSGVPNVVGFYYVGALGNYAFRVVSPANVTAVTAMGCTVTTPSIAVNLPAISAASLGSAGAAAGKTPFEIDLTCASGVRVNVTLTDASNMSNVSTTLGLTTGSTATGVGLQVINGGTTIGYGPDSALIGTTNQWSAGTASGGVMKIPLTAQYVRTAGSLTPGKVTAAATFTMSYQ